MSIVVVVVPRGTRRGTGIYVGTRELCGITEGLREVAREGVELEDGVVAVISLLGVVVGLILVLVGGDAAEGCKVDDGVGVRAVVMVEGEGVA